MDSARRLYTAATLIWLAATSLCAARTTEAVKQYSAEELIAQIIASEKKIHDVQLHFDNILVGQGNHVARSLDWGYQGGKWYLAGREFNLSVPEEDIPAWEKQIRVAFDGRRYYLFQERTNFRDGQAIKDGWGGSIGPDMGTLCLSPTTFLGYGLSKKHRTFGELLRDCRHVSVSPRVGIIDGRRCVVIEAIGIIRHERSRLEFDVRAWIDAERDFRPLRIDRCRSIGGKNRWKVLVSRREDIELKKIDGIWLPVEGTSLIYNTKEAVPPGMTVAQFRRLSSKRQNEVVIFTQAPLSDEATKMRVSEGTVRINKGIDPNKFTIEFPKGCKVVDDFRLTQYTIGEEGDPALASDSSGSTVLQRLSDFKVPFDPEKAKGKRILICFWKMDDPKSTQMLKRLRDRADYFAESGVFVALVHAQRAEPAVIERWLLTRQVSLSSGVVVNAGDAGGRWKVQSLPGLALTDTEHLVMATDFDWSELNAMIERGR